MSVRLPQIQNVKLMSTSSLPTLSFHDGVDGSPAKAQSPPKFMIRKPSHVSQLSVSAPNSVSTVNQRATSRTQQQQQHQPLSPLPVRATLEKVPYRIPAALSDLPATYALRRLSALLSSHDVVLAISQAYALCTARLVALKQRQNRKAWSKARSSSSPAASPSILFPQPPPCCQCKCHVRKPSIPQFNPSRQAHSTNVELASNFEISMGSPHLRGSMSPTADRHRPQKDSMSVDVSAATFVLEARSVAAANRNAPKNFGCSERRQCCARRLYQVCPYKIISLDEPIRIEAGLANRPACDALLSAIISARGEVKGLLRRRTHGGSPGRSTSRRYSISTGSGAVLEHYSNGKEWDMSDPEALVARIEELCGARTFEPAKGARLELASQPHWSVAWLDFVLLVTCISESEWLAVTEASRTQYALIVRNLAPFRNVLDAIVQHSDGANVPTSLISHQQHVATAAFANKLRLGNGKLNSNAIDRLATKVGQCLQDTAILDGALSTVHEKKGFDSTSTDSGQPVLALQSDDAFVAAVISDALRRSRSADPPIAERTRSMVDALVTILTALDGKGAHSAHMEDSSDSVRHAVAHSAVANRHKCSVGPLDTLGVRAPSAHSMWGGSSEDLSLFDVVGVRASSLGVTAELGFSAQEALRWMREHAPTQLDIQAVKTALSEAAQPRRSMQPAEKEKTLLSINTTLALSSEETHLSVDSPPLSISGSPKEGSPVKDKAPSPIYNARRLPPCPTKLMNKSTHLKPITAAASKPLKVINQGNPSDSEVTNLPIPSLLPPMPSPNRPQTAAQMAVGARSQRLAGLLTALTSSSLNVERKSILVWAWRAWMRSYAATKSYRRRFVYPALRYPLRNIALRLYFKQWVGSAQQVSRPRLRRKAGNPQDMSSKLGAIARAAEAMLRFRYLDRWALYSTSSIAARDLLQTVLANVRGGLPLSQSWSER